jgi:hypothetical protein
MHIYNRSEERRNREERDREKGRKRDTAGSKDTT